MNIKYLLLSCCIVLSACSVEAQKKTSTDLPEWVNTPYAEYSENQYLLAVGSGSSQQDAQNSALANLSRIFKSKVETSQQLIDDFKEYVQDDSFSSERSTQLLTVTRVGSSQNLLNTKILKTHKTPSLFYALAGMERFETATIYSSEIAENEMHIEDLLEQAENADHKLYKIGYLKKAQVLAEANANLSAQLSILTGGQDETANQQHIISDINARLNKIKQQTRVIIAYPRDVSSPIQRSVANAFSSSGFTVIQAGDEDIYARVSFSTRETSLNRPNAVFIQWDLEISARDAIAGTELSTFSASGREGALSLDDALRRAEMAAKKHIKDKFDSFINQQYLSN